MIDQNKKIFVFAGEEPKNFLMNGNYFFDGTFKSCPKQFTQCTIFFKCATLLRYMLFHDLKG